MSKDKAVDKAKDSTFVEMDIGANRRFVVPYPVYKYIIKLKQTRRQVIRDVVEKIEKVQNPYPDNIFIEPTKKQWKEIHEYLNSIGRLIYNNMRKDLITKIKSLEEVKQNDKNEESKTT
jgi:phage-related protein